ncbi:LysR family transcriptional regulator [Bradyrhizobium sp. SRL28]|uniref:LysR family transcriptional regulator n=1 Tax=Bradyrhizobium sp. SRL28 TaxID=2836178 RepID=UPI001BDEED8B|nr:LysR family transcriptional regulator [Bradyrhizobium sp. SRL28]MBT1517189.1 LysR family transcriptional regulator [Bradyrhizobium sp. SRL28]
MALELRHFRYFVAVAEEGHITRAAERLGMQQPPLSQRIRFIEDELGAQLFLRRARGVELTQAGRAFLETARSMLSQYEGAYETVRRAARGQTGRLCVGATPTSAFHPIVPLAIRSFRDEFPQVKLTLEERLPADLIKRLQEKSIDVAFLRAETFEETDLSVRPLLTEPMVVALPTGHRLARVNGAIALKDLARDAFIVFARQTGPAFFETTIAACREAGFSPTLGQEAPRVTSALNLVAAGLGVCVVPTSVMRMAMEGIVYHPLKGSGLLKAPINLVSRRGDPAAVVRNFLNAIRRAKGTLADPK